MTVPVSSTMRIDAPPSDDGFVLGSARHREDVTSLQHDRTVAQGGRQGDRFSHACTVRKFGFGYAAWEYSLISPLRTRRRRTRTVARSVTGAEEMSRAGGRCSRP